jgi:hypothetical protein
MDSSTNLQIQQHLFIILLLSFILYLRTHYENLLSDLQEREENYNTHIDNMQ